MFSKPLKWLLPIIALAFSLATYSSPTCNDSPITAPSNFTLGLPISSLPSLFVNSSRSPNDAAAIEQIRNTLALYPLAIDGKDFAALADVFSADVVANYSAPLGVLTGLPAVEGALAMNLAPVMTQHAFSTQIIDVMDGGCAAMCVTYYTASHFGTGVRAGQVLYAYGQYQDILQKNSTSEEWRIKYRNLVYMGPFIGNLSVFA